MGAIPVAVQVGVCVLISVAAVAALLVVWCDDHRWRERNGAGPAVEPDPALLGLHDLVRRPAAHHHDRS